MLADREHKRKLRDMAVSTKEAHEEQMKEHMQKWKDPYGEKQ